MTDNPYLPPAVEPDPTRTRSLASRCLFFITAILGVVCGGISPLSLTESIGFATRNGGWVPPYIVGMTIVTALCAFILFFSAKMWRLGLARPGAISLLAAIMLYLGAPRILLPILAG